MHPLHKLLVDSLFGVKGSWEKLSERINNGNFSEIRIILEKCLVYGVLEKNNMSPHAAKIRQCIDDNALFLANKKTLNETDIKDYYLVMAFLGKLSGRYHKVLSYLDEAARLGDSEAMVLFANHFISVGNLTKAKEYLIKAISKNNPSAMFLLAFHYHFTSRNIKEQEEGIRLLKRAKELGDTDAMGHLIKLSLHNPNTLGAEIVFLYEEAMRGGSASAYYDLAKLYHDHPAIFPKSSTIPVEATVVQLLHKARILGYKPAQIAKEELLDNTNVMSLYHYANNLLLMNYGQTALLEAIKHLFQASKLTCSAKETSKITVTLQQIVDYVTQHPNQDDDVVANLFLTCKQFNMDKRAELQTVANRDMLIKTSKIIALTPITTPIATPSSSSIAHFFHHRLQEIFPHHQNLTCHHRRLKEIEHPDKKYKAIALSGAQLYSSEQSYLRGYGLRLFKHQDQLMILLKEDTTERLQGIGCFSPKIQHGLMDEMD